MLIFYLQNADENAVASTTPPVPLLNIYELKRRPAYNVRQTLVERYNKPNQERKTTSHHELQYTNQHSCNYTVYTENHTNNKNGLLTQQCVLCVVCTQVPPLHQLRITISATTQLTQLRGFFLVSLLLLMECCCWL